MSMLRAMQRTSLNVPITVTQRSACVLALSLLMTACASRLDQAPVVDLSGGSALSTQAAQPSVPPGPPPPGYYRVKPGDTLYRIALENGQNYRDISAWNNLTNPNQIEVNQLLRVVPPGANTAGLTPGVSTAPLGSGGAVQSAPLGSAPSSAGAAAGVAAPPLYGSAANNSAALTPPAAGAANESGNSAAGNIAFSWPVHGPLLGTFNDSTNKGVNIGGALGDPVKASADGRVVYAGNGLRGYGNLIIIKHDATYLTAYAHNRALMVKEGDAVTKGQKIAEMGNSDADRVMLHFEVRRQGKPVDPLKYLPPQ